MDLNLDQDLWSSEKKSKRYASGTTQVTESETALNERQQLQADYAQAVARAEQQEHQSQALFSLSQNVAVTLELDDLRQSIVEAFYESLRADTASLFLCEQDGVLRMVAQCNIDLTRARLTFGPEEGLVAWAAREHRVLYAPDTSANSHYTPTHYDRPRSMLAVPIDPHNGATYVLCIVRRRIYAFTDDEVQFAHLMGSVAAHALSNAALYSEMSALANEQATLYELALASSISDGVSTFIDRAVEPLRGALNATGCAVMLLPEDLVLDTNLHGRIASQDMSAHGLAQCSAFANELIQYKDVSNERVAVRCDVSPDGSRLVLAPVIAHNQPVAIIGWELLVGGTVQDDATLAVSMGTVWNTTQQLYTAMPAIVLPVSSQPMPPLPLSESETTFIASVSQQLSLGIENLHLRVRDMGAFRSISALPASRPHLDHVRKSIVIEIAKAFAPAVVALIMRDELSGEARVVATSHDANASWVQSAIKLAAETTELRQHRGTVITALIADHEVIGWIAMRLVGTARISSDRALVFTSLTGAAALILRNARLHIMAREVAVDRERQRIAREIHDGVAQNLAHLMLRLELVQRLVTMDPDRACIEAEGARQVLFSSLNDLRHSIAALAPAQLEELGFAGAVQSLLDDVATNTPELTVIFKTCPDTAIPTELRAPAFRVIQEALSNIRKHANARHAWITVTRTKDDALHVTIRDDGNGFIPDDVKTISGHFGLRGMRERAEEFGGTLTIKSLPDTGATVTLMLPLALAA